MTTIRLLGRFAVERDGREIAWTEFGGELARRLLRMLALRRGSLVLKDLIAEALWTDHPPADARGNIEVLVSRIRRALGDRTLVRTGPGGYLLAADERCWVDAEAFLAAVRAGQAALASHPAQALTWFRAALDIWCGDPLPEDTYARWAQVDRRLLSLAHLEALDGAAAAALHGIGAAGAAEATSWARRALAAEPLRESSVLLLVRGLAAAGDQVGALAAFDKYRDRLAVETGLDPTPQARAIRQRVLVGQWEAGLPDYVPAMRSARTRRSAPGRKDYFLGREAECALIGDVASGHGPPIVLVTGPSGIGKSALLTEAARRVDLPVLRAQASVWDRGEPWSLAGRLLHQAVERLPVPVTAVLTQPEATALAEVVPGLTRRSGAALGAGRPQDGRVLAGQGAVRLMAAIAQPRCLVVADDLHWADPDSLNLLGLLLRRLNGVSLAAAYRPDGSPGVDAAAALGVPATQITTITLGPLPAGVVRGLFADPLLAADILSQAEHTPFTVPEVIAALARQGAITGGSDRKWRLRPGRDAGTAAAIGAALEQVAGNRLAGVPSHWRNQLNLLALLGRPAPPALLAAASTTDLGTVLAALHGLSNAGLARLDPQGWVLSHELVRRAVGASLRSPEAARIHTLLATALRQSSVDPAEVASHQAASGDTERAAMTYATAARRQLERICDREAMHLAQTGLSLAPAGRTRAVLLEVRGEAERRTGQLAAARADFTAAVDCLNEPASRSHLLAQLAILDARTVDAARGAGLAELAVAEAAEAAEQPAALGQALAASAIIDLTAGNLARARRRASRAARLLDRAGDRRGSTRLQYCRALAPFMACRLPEAVTELGRLANLPAPYGEALRLWSPRATRGHALAFLGHAEQGLAEIDSVRAWAGAARHPAIEAECLWRRSEVLAFLGHATESMESAEESAHIAARLGHAEWTAAAYRGLGIGCEAAGLPDRAGAAYRRSLEAAEFNPFFRAWAAARLGAFLARQGQPRQATPHVQAALAGGTPLTRREARWAHAELLASRGQQHACRAVATAALKHARRSGYLILVPRLNELISH